MIMILMIDYVFLEGMQCVAVFVIGLSSLVMMLISGFLSGGSSNHFVTIM